MAKKGVRKWNNLRERVHIKLFRIEATKVKYYHANGQYLGKVGNSSDIRVSIVGDIDKAKENLACVKCNHEWLLEHSLPAYKLDKEKDRLIKWSRLNQPKIYAHLHPDPEKEIGMMLFKNVLTDGSGNQFEVIMEGNTIVGEISKSYSSKAYVYWDDSKLIIKGLNLETGYGKFNWVRYHMIHTHPKRGEDELSNDFNSSNLFGSDVTTAIKNNGKSSMISYNYPYIKTFDSSIYNAVVVKDGDKIYEKEHDIAVETATTQIYFLD